MNKNSAFTLVELAIVIVIIGLLVGGVLQGQALIEQAKQRAVIKDYQGYQAAYNTFYAKYNCIPGDCIKAQMFFGATECPDVANNTCNGNGDRTINVQTASAAEDMRFWQHLSLAKVIKGTYTGITGSGTGDGYIVQKNVNIPASSYGLGVYHAYRNVTTVGYTAKNKNVIRWGDRHANTVYSSAGVVYAEDAYSLDSKLDDGLASTGSIYAINGVDGTGDHAITGCTDGYYTNASVNYVMSDKTNKCAIHMALE
jgi:prepilin-type N-terminal cleavage/methylation domain-containing protein